MEPTKQNRPPNRQENQHNLKPSNLKQQKKKKTNSRIKTHEHRQQQHNIDGASEQQTPNNLILFSLIYHFCVLKMLSIFLGQFYVFEGIDLLKNIHMYRQQTIN